MKNKRFVIIIGWCPDSINAIELQDILEDKIGTSVLVVEE